MDLQPQLLRKSGNIPPRTGIKHPFLDGRARWTGINEDDSLLGSRVVIKSVPRRGGGNMGSDGIRFNAGLLGFLQFEGFGWNVNGLYSYPYSYY